MEPANRLAGYFDKMDRERTPEVAADPKVVTDTITRAIGLKWTKSQKKLADRAEVSESALHALKRDGCTELTTVLKSVSFAIGVDPRGILRGEIIDADPEPSDDLVAIAKDLVGTEHERAAKVMLDHLRRVRRVLPD